MQLNILNAFRYIKKHLNTVNAFKSIKCIKYI